MWQNLADAELVAHALTGEGEAFDELVRRHWPVAASLAYQRVRRWADAQDVAQDAFVLAFRKLAALRDPERFGGWLYQIVRRTCAEHVRRHKRRPMLLVDEPEMLGESVERAPESPTREQRDAAEAIQAAIAELPERYRKVVALRYGMGLSVKEICKILDLPFGTVVSHMYRANRLLRPRLKNLVKQP